jgi:transposase-like protein
MNCPNCENQKAYKNGTRKGVQYFYCKLCKHSWSDATRSVGQPTIYDRPMTSTERKARFRAKEKDRLIDKLIDLD